MIIAAVRNVAVVRPNDRLNADVDCGGFASINRKLARRAANGHREVALREGEFDGIATMQSAVARSEGLPIVPIARRILDIRSVSTGRVERRFESGQDLWQAAICPEMDVVEVRCLIDESAPR